MWTRRASSRLRAPPARPCSAARARTCELRLLCLGLRGPALEALDAATRVNELLLARIEGVALGAQLGAQLGRGGTSHELVSARAMHPALDVFGVDIGLHGPSSLGQAHGGPPSDPITV